MFTAIILPLITGFGDICHVIPGNTVSPQILLWFCSTNMITYQHRLPRKQQVELRCRLRSFPNGACLLADVDDIEVYAK